VKYRFLSVLIAISFLSLSSQGPLQAAQKEHDAVLEAATKTVEKFFGQKDMLGIKNLVGGSKALLIVPEFETGAFFVAIEGGSGLFITRHGEKWGDPVFIKLSQKSIGLQFGVKESELMMLVLTRGAVDQFVHGNSETAGSGGIALGDWGVGASTGGGLKAGIQSMTVIESKGLALGGGIGNAELTMRTDLNKAVYGEDFDFVVTLMSKGGTLPAAAKLRTLLDDAVKASWWD